MYENLHQEETTIHQKECTQANATFAVNKYCTQIAFLWVSRVHVKKQRTCCY